MIPLIGTSLTPEDQGRRFADIAQQMSSLLNHPGWQYIDATLASLEAIAFSNMEAAKTGDELVKLAGVYTTLKRIRGLPAAQLEACTKGLKQQVTP